jgi:hypothetical protein
VPAPKESAGTFRPDAPRRRNSMVKLLTFDVI